MRNNMFRPKLRLIGDTPEIPTQAQEALGQLKTLDLSRQIVAIYNRAHIVRPAYLRRPLKIMPLSPSMGMGLSQNNFTKDPVAHIDHDFLDSILERQNKRLRPVTAAYFVLAAGAHSLVRDMPIVAKLSREDAYVALSRSWAWAGSLALEELKPRQSVRDEMLVTCKESARELEIDHQGDMMFFLHQAELLGVEPPKIRPVVPWIGIAFPQALSDLQPVNPLDVR